MTGLIAGAFVTTVWVANWLVVHVGPVPVGFGLIAPAGVYAAGVALTLRDLLQERAGRRAVAGAILVGAMLSAGLNGQLAVASGVAFLVSEAADWLVYTPLRARGWIVAVVASNLVGLVIDSAVFLGLAFGSWEYLAGQVVGKAWMTLAVVAGYALLRRAPSPV